MEKLPCFSDLMPASRQSFSSMGLISISLAPSIRKIFFHCLQWVKATWLSKSIWSARFLESEDKRFAALRDFYPNAKQEDWKVEVAGQRVQIIKKDPAHGGILEFGTELVVASDRSIVAMLGASPGASTAVWIMVHVIERCFPEKLSSTAWLPKLQQLIPSYGQSLIDNPALCQRLRAEPTAVLNINNITTKETENDPSISLVHRA